MLRSTSVAAWGGSRERWQMSLANALASIFRHRWLNAPESSTPTNQTAHSSKTRPTVLLSLRMAALQHLPSQSAIETCVRELIRVLRPGGLLVFQVPSTIEARHRLQPRRRVWTMLRALHVSRQYLYRTLGLYPIRMTAVPERAVRSLLQDQGVTLLRVDELVDDRHAWQDRTYWVTRA